MESQDDDAVKERGKKTLTLDNILPEAGMVALTDVVEAMPSRRPYCPPLGVEKAVKEITSTKANIKVIDFYVTILYNYN